MLIPPGINRTIITRFSINRDSAGLEIRGSPKVVSPLIKTDKFNGKYNNA
jgi:hypothetical protein